MKKEEYRSKKGRPKNDFRKVHTAVYIHEIQREFLNRLVEKKEIKSLNNYLQNLITEDIHRRLDKMDPQITKKTEGKENGNE